MSFEILPQSAALMQRKALEEIEKCNLTTVKFGLTLSSVNIARLIEVRTQALKANGRIEFGGGAIDKIIKEFCDSPYISMDNYVETLQELIEMFYYYKNETLDLLTDDELIKFMKDRFDGPCQGSLELLSERDLYIMSRNIRYGYSRDYSEDEVYYEEEEDENECY